MPQVAKVLPLRRRRPSVYERAERKRKRRRPPEIPSRDEVKRLLALLKRRTDAFRDYPLFLLALETGMRAGTLAGLQVGDLRDSRGRCRKCIRLRADIVKGGFAYSVPLRRKVREVVDVYLAALNGEPDMPLFPSRKGAEPLTVRAIQPGWPSVDLHNPALRPPERRRPPGRCRGGVRERLARRAPHRELGGLGCPCDCPQYPPSIAPSHPQHRRFPSRSAPSTAGL
jgi:integrase